MGANLSQQRQHDIARNRLLAELRPYLVPGWRLSTGLRFEPVPTLRGCLARGQEIVFRCGRRDCKRRVEVDLEAACRARLGEETPYALFHRFACRHYDRCGLRMSEEWTGGEPLIALFQRPGAALRVACLACEHASLVTPRAVIDRLKALGTGDGATGVGRVAGCLRGCCRRCGSRKFEVEAVEVPPGRRALGPAAPGLRRGEGRG
jgi:hypothetical protein